jgi:plastocyanin
MSRTLDSYKFHATFVIAILSMAILLPGINLAHYALGQSKTTSVSIVKGASNPSTKEPYNPSPLSVTVGTTVTWTNNDNTGHTVTEGNPSGNTPQNGFDSGILGPGKTFAHTFDKPGSTQYYCTLHPTMLGEVIIK